MSGIQSIYNLAKAEVQATANILEVQIDFESPIDTTFTGFLVKKIVEGRKVFLALYYFKLGKNDQVEFAHYNQQDLNGGVLDDPCWMPIDIDISIPDTLMEAITVFEDYSQN